MRRLLAVLVAFAAIAAHADVIVVANRGGTVATIIDPVTMTVLGQPDAGPQPHEVAGSANGRLAYISNYANGTGTTLSVIDLQSRTKVKEMSLLNLQGFSISLLRAPHGLAERNGKIYFTAEGSAAVARYDPAADRIDWIGKTNQSITHMLAVKRDASTVYAVNILSNTVSVVPVSGNESVARKQIAVINSPEGIALSPDERELWVGSSKTGGIGIIDTATEEMVAAITPGEFAYRITFTPDGKYVLVPRANAVIVYDVASRTQLRSIDAEGTVLSIIAPDEKTAYVSTGNPDRVTKLDLTTFTFGAFAAASPLPDGMAYIRTPTTGPKRRAVVHM